MLKGRFGDDKGLWVGLELLECSLDDLVRDLDAVVHGHTGDLIGLGCPCDLVDDHG